jgi:hypothetical protein
MKEIPHKNFSPPTIKTRRFGDNLLGNKLIKSIINKNTQMAEIQTHLEISDLCAHGIKRLL